MNDPTARDALNKAAHALISDAELPDDADYGLIDLSLSVDPALGPGFKAGHRRATRAAVTWMHHRRKLPGQHSILNTFAYRLGIEARCQHRLPLTDAQE